MGPDSRPPLKFRISRTDDLEVIAELDDQCFQWETEVDERAVWWVATLDSEPVAYAGAIDLGDGLWYLNRAGTLRPFRGNGLQKRLVRTRVRYAQATGGKRVVTYTAPHSSASMRALISCGFRPYRRNGWDSWVLWERKLRGT